MKYVIFTLRVSVFIATIMASTAIMVFMAACLIMLVGAR